MIIAENPRLFRNLCKLAYSFRTLKIRFDETSKIVSFVNNSNSKSFVDWRYLLSAVLTGLYAIQCLLKKSSSGNPMESVLIWFSLATLVACQLYLHQLRKKHLELAFLFNSLFRINLPLENNDSKQKCSGFKANVALAYTLLLTGVVLPTGFVHTLHWKNPCKTTLAGYWLIPRCYSSKLAEASENEFADFAWQLGVILVIHWLWMFLYHASIFGTASQALLVAAFQQILQRLQLNTTRLQRLHFV